MLRLIICFDAKILIKVDITMLIPLKKHYLRVGKQCLGLPLAPIRRERKVRAAKDAPLLNMEAVGDSRSR